MMQTAKKTVMVLVSALALALSAGGAVHLSAIAEEEEAIEVGQYILEMEDAKGEKRSLPAWYDGKEYLLADYTRNIFVHNGFGATSLQEIVGGVNNFPIYSSKTGEFSDRMAVSLYYNTLTSYDFYTKENIGEDYFGFKGTNDNIAGNWRDNPLEVPVHCFVHVNSGNYRYNAACYTENGMGFLVAGDGDKTNTQFDMFQQAACIDVIAHEFQHGIAKHLKDGLTYEGESGALDEAFADIFGMLISGEDMESEKFWMIGEDCTVSGEANRRIDYPLQSHSAGYREKLSSKHVCAMHSGSHPASCDYNYVHYNSTIVSHVQFTAWQVAPQIFTKSAIATLWFNTLKLLNKNANFNDFAVAIRQAAQDVNLPEEGKAALDYSLYVNGFIKDVMHKVTFVDDEENVLFYMAVKHGGSIDKITTELKDSEFYDYEFTSWDGDLSFITDDITVKAVYKKTPKNFTVRFVMDDGTLLEEKSIPYGSMLEYPLEDPKKEADENYEYRFTGWDNEKETVDGDMTVTALFDKIEKIKEDPAAPPPSSPSPFPIGLVLGIVGGAVVLIGIIAAIVIVKKKKQ